jgi:hypothetical protein
MWALLQFKDGRAKPVALKALESEDEHLRTLAAALLGTLRAQDATSALLGVLTAERATPTDGDRAQAMLALADIGDPTHLLSAAAAVSSGSPTVIESLLFMFQTLSPRLPKDQEAKVLVAVLGHAQPMLRRYAVQRLGELREPSTTRALEGRLASEDRELRPLIEVSLAAVRGGTVGDAGDGTGDGFWAKARVKAREAKAAAVKWWTSAPMGQRYGALGVAVLALLALVGIRLAAARRRRRQSAESWAAMTGPSAGFEPGEPAYAEEGELTGSSRFSPRRR